jgi:putative membrane protein
MVRRQPSNARRPRSFSVGRKQPEAVARTASESAPHLPLPATTPGEVEPKTGKPEYLEIPKPSRTSASIGGPNSVATLGEADLLPARDPPQYSYFDLFPFSLLVKFLTKRGRKLKGKKAALLRAKLHHQSATQNLPLEISLYIVRFPFRWGCVLVFSMTPQSSYIAVLQSRKAIDAATTCMCLVDAERTKLTIPHVAQLT